MVFPGNFRKILRCVNLEIFHLFFLLLNGTKEEKFSILSATCFIRFECNSLMGIPCNQLSLLKKLHHGNE
jgi:hypothetical protein